LIQYPLLAQLEEAIGYAAAESLFVIKNQSWQKKALAHTAETRLKRLIAGEISLKSTER